MFPWIPRPRRSTAIWIVGATALAGFGGRRGKRAALRGVLAAGAASVVSTSNSTAPIAAFATAVAIEAPSFGAPIGIAAATTEWARLRRGGRTPANVVVNNAIGVGVALATTKVWPRADYSPATAEVVPPALARVVGEPSADGAGLTIVINPSARSGKGEDPTDELRAALPAAKIVALDDAGDLEGALREAAADARAIGVVGGDGSINTAAGIALEHNCPLVVVPGGTLNHFARDLGLDTVDDSVRAVKSGQLVAIDVGLIDDHVFINTASFGSYSKLVEAREKLESTIGKWPALAIALFRVLRDEDPLVVTIDGRTRKIWMIFIGNCAYDPPGFAPVTRARLDDGQFDIRVVDGSTPWARARLIFAVLTGNLATSTVYSRRLASSMRIRTDADDSLLAADGEIFEGHREFTVAKHDARLLIYTPEN